MDEQSPLRFPAHIRELALAADVAMDRNPQGAYDAVIAELEAIRRAEAELHLRFHKGHALYNLGVIQLGRAPQVARLNFMAAYIEDVRTWPNARPQGAVAARVLSDLFGLQRFWFAALARLARAAPREDPVAAAEAFTASHDLPEIDFDVPHDSSRTEGELAGPPTALLVFLGGTYRKCPDRITNARLVIEEAGVTPVVVREFEYLAGEDERSKSFRLLDKCGRAVFEASEPGGWTPELERLVTLRPSTPTLIQWASEARLTIHPAKMIPGVSSMPNIVHRSYRNHWEMRYNLLAWLGRNPTGPGYPSVPGTRLAVASNTPPPSGWALPGTAYPGDTE
jgi:hypothetical protein